VCPESNKTRCERDFHALDDGIQQSFPMILKACNKTHAVRKTRNQRDRSVAVVVVAVVPVLVLMRHISKKSQCCQQNGTQQSLPEIVRRLFHFLIDLLQFHDHLFFHFLPLESFVVDTLGQLVQSLEIM